MIEDKVLNYTIIISIAVMFMSVPAGILSYLLSWAPFLFLIPLLGGICVLIFGMLLMILISAINEL